MPPAVVFFPGATGAGEFWSPVAQRLPRHWHTELLSWPGAGAVPAAHGIEGYADLVDFAAAAVPDGSDVLAQSMGDQPDRGRQALHEVLPQSALHVIAGGTHALARERPDEVAALIQRHLGAPPA